MKGKSNQILSVICFISKQGSHINVVRVNQDKVILMGNFVQLISPDASYSRMPLGHRKRRKKDLFCGPVAQHYLCLGNKVIKSSYLKKISISDDFIFNYQLCHLLFYQLMIFPLCHLVISVGAKSTYSSLALYYENNRFH